MCLLTSSCREQIAYGKRTSNSSESGYSPGSSRRKQAATKAVGSHSARHPGPVPPFEPDLVGRTPKHKTKKKERSRKAPGNLSLQLEQTQRTLRELLSYMYTEDHKLPSCHEAGLREKISGSRYGCFEALAANCYIVREWQREQAELISNVWSVRAQISDTYAEAKKVIDGTAYVLSLGGGCDPC